MRASKSCKAWYNVASTMLKGGWSNTIRQYAGDSSTTRSGPASSATVHLRLVDLDRAGRRCDVRRLVGPHPSKSSVADAQFQEEISFERQSLCQRRLGRVADKPLNGRNRFRRAGRQSTGDLHCPIQRLTAYALVDKAKPCSFLRVDGIAHEHVHESRRRSDGARQPLRAAGPGDESQVGLRQSDQVVAILGDAQIAGERELECASQTCSGNGGDYRFWHALAERYGLVEKSCVVSRVVGPLAAGSAEGLGELQERGDRKVASEIPGRAARQYHGANIGIPSVTIQRRGERVAHLRVEIDSPGTTQRNDCDSLDHARGQNVGGHGILLSCDRLCFSPLVARMRKRAATHAL